MYMYNIMIVKVHLRIQLDAYYTLVMMEPYRSIYAASCVSLDQIFGRCHGSDVGLPRKVYFRLYDVSPGESGSKVHLLNEPSVD
jgi:hypothetical protein